MIRRLCTIARTETLEEMPAPTGSEAVAVWILGTSWLVSSMALAAFELRSSVPALLLGGMIAVWGWRQNRWLSWVPITAIAAAALDVIAPQQVGVGGTPVGYVEIVAAAVALVGLARVLARPRKLVSRTGVVGAIAAGLALGGIVWASGPPMNAITHLRHVIAAGVLGFATVILARRPRGVRWSWPAFPMAAALVGLHAVWTGLSRSEALVTHARAADAVWGHTNTLTAALAILLPCTWALAIHDKRHRGWHVAAGSLASIGFGIHLHAGFWLGDPAALPRLGHPLGFVMEALKVAAMSWLAMCCFERGKPFHFRHALAAGLAATFLIAGLVELVGDGLAIVPVQILVAIATGNALGSLRAYETGTQRTGEQVTHPSGALSMVEAA